MAELVVLVVALLGLLVGSFVNVVIHRVPQRESVVTPSSHCPKCGAPVRWYDNLPVLSYLLLRGRCRACRERISLVYPGVELLVAVLFGAHAWQLGPQPLLISRLVLVAALVALLVIDLRHHLLPNAITIPGIVVGFLLSLVLPPGWQGASLGIVAGGGIPWLIAELYYRLRGVEGLGMGDVKMLAMIGGFLGWELMLVTLVLGSLLGSMVGLAVLVSKRGGLRYALPFGTFLAIGALTASLAGEALLSWYLRLY